MALEIVQIIASGSFGHVAVVRDPGTGRLLAAKALKDAHASNPKLLARLRDEAALLSRLDHPHLVQLEGFREIEGRPVLLLEWVRGVSLTQVLGRCPQGLPPGDVCEAVRRTALALDAAWSTPDPTTGRPLRVIHRDVKPSNVLLSAEGEVKVVDLGIAKGSFAGKEAETVSVVLGAYGYLAPERLDGAEDAPAGDVFALGCMFFELLTGRKIELSLHPDHHAERMQRHLMHLRPEGVGPRVVGQLSALIMRMAAYAPEDRPTHAQIAHALQQLLQMTGWRPDLPTLAEQHVVPLLEERTTVPPHLHPAWADLAFLEAPSGQTPVPAAPRQSDERIREFLATPGWEHREAQLRRMLAIDPSWTEAPLLEALEQIRRSQRRGLLSFLWRRRSRDRSSREQLRVLLELLKARPGAEVRKRAWPFVSHADPEISELARQVYVA